MLHLILAIFVAYGEWANLAIVCHYEHTMNLLTVPTAIYSYFFF